MYIFSLFKSLLKQECSHDDRLRGNKFFLTVAKINVVFPIEAFNISVSLVYFLVNLYSKYLNRSFDQTKFLLTSGFIGPGRLRVTHILKSF